MKSVLIFLISIFVPLSAFCVETFVLDYKINNKKYHYARTNKEIVFISEPLSKQYSLGKCDVKPFLDLENKFLMLGKSNKTPRIKNIPENQIIRIHFQNVNNVTTLKVQPLGKFLSEFDIHLFEAKLSSDSTCKK